MNMVIVNLLQDMLKYNVELLTNNEPKFKLSANL